MTSRCDETCFPVWSRDARARHKARFTQRFSVSLRYTAFLCCVYLSFHAYHTALLLFTVRDYFFLAEGRLLVIYLMKVAPIHFFFTLIFLLCGSRFIKAIRYSRHMLYRGLSPLRVEPNNALQLLLIHDTAQPLVPSCLHNDC